MNRVPMAAVAPRIQDLSVEELRELTRAHIALSEPVALLKAPRHESLAVSSFSDETHTEITVTSKVSDELRLDIVSRRGEISVAHHTWGALINYQLRLASMRGQHPWGGGPAPEEIEPRIDANNPPSMTGARQLLAVGESVSWEFIECADIGSGEPIAAIGGRLGNITVAVAGPAGSLTGLELETFPAMS